MFIPVLDGCGTKWLSRQLSAQGEKAARRQTVMGIWRQDALDGKRARATVGQFSTELCCTNCAKSVLLWRTMLSTAHLYSSPTISLSWNEPPQVASYVSCYQTAESHLSGWQSQTFQRVPSHLDPQDTLFVRRISTLEIRNSNQLLKSICHSVTRKPFLPSMKLSHRLDLSGGHPSRILFCAPVWIFTQPYTCTPMCTHTHTHTNKEEHLVVSYSQRSTRRKIKFKGLINWGQREADFAWLREYLQLGPAGCNDCVASASSTTFPKHILQKS